MNCLILAAGQGSRLSGHHEPKPLVPVGGLPLLERVILTAQAAGATSFHVVTGCHGERLHTFLEDLRQRRSLAITTLANGVWERGNGASALCAQDLLHEPFLLLMGDHLVSKELLASLVNTGLQDADIRLAVDRTLTANHLVDPEDATRVLVAADGKITDIGKEISPYNAYDTGCFLCTPRIFPALEEAARSGDSSLSAGVRLLAKRGKGWAHVVDRGYWVDVDTPAQLAKAERLTRESLRKATDGPISHYVNRPLSLRLSWVLARWGTPPGVLSFLAFLVAGVGAALMFLSGYLPLALGGLLVQLSSILDGCDGEVARLQERTSAFGGWLDSILDRYADALILVGLTYHAYRERPGWLVLGIGLAATVGALVNTYSAARFDDLLDGTVFRGRRPPLRIGRDVRLFVVFVGSLLNLPLATLAFLALLMNGEVVRRAVILRTGIR